MHRYFQEGSINFENIKKHLLFSCASVYNGHSLSKRRKTALTADHLSNRQHNKNEDIMEKKIKAVIFDLDGTLLNSLTDLRDSVNATMTKHGFPTHSTDAVRRFVGNGVAKLIERAIPGGRENEEFEDCLSDFKEHYALHMYDKTAAYDGIYEMLDSLKEKGYRLAVVSNKFDAAVKELCKRYFPDHIEVAIGECESAGIKKKPAPDTVIEALRMLCVSNCEAVYVGDSEVDVHTAKNSYMECVSVLWGFREKDFLKSEGARIFASTPSELEVIIAELG